jgi:PAS domain S-box-containing protein
MAHETNVSRIGRIVEAVRKAIDGDYSFQIETSDKNDDIDILAEAINQLAENAMDRVADHKKSSRALFDVEKRLRRLEENIPGMVYLFARHTDGTFTFPYVNEASLDLFAISPGDLKRDATLLTRLIHPDDREKFDASVQQSARTLQPWREILRHIVRGEVRWYDCISHPEQQPNGDIIWDGIILEVTDQMKAVELLRESEKKLSGIISASPVGIAIYDGSGQCISTNDSFARIIGASKQQVLRQNYNNLESWKKSELLDMARTVVRTRSANRTEVATISSFGKEVILDSHLVPFGEAGLLFMSQDISERKRAEEVIHRSEKQFKTLFMSMSDGFYLSEVLFDDSGNPCDYRYVEVNPKFEQILGLSRDQIIGKRYKELVPVDTTGWLDTYCTVARTGAPLNYEFHSSEFQTDFETYSYQPTKGQVSVIVRDITERKRWEEALSESEATLRSIYESSPMLMGVVELAEDDRIWHVYDNPATARFFDIPYQGTKQKTADEMGAPSDAIHEWLVGYRQSLQQGKPVSFEYVHHASDGPLWLSATVSVIGPGRSGRTRFSYVAEDITKRKRAEEDLRRAKAYSEKLIETANAMIIVLNAQGTVQVFNRAAEKITGYAREELIGRNWFEVLVPRDQYPGVWESFQKSSLDGLPESFENPILTKAGEERFISWQNTELSDGGAFGGSLSYGIDITERKHLEEQLLQSQRMEAIGQLTGGIAHDFNNMLSVILGHAELVKSGLPSGDPLLKDVLAIENAGLHSRDVTRQLLAFSRKQIIAPKTTNLNQLILNTKETIAKLIGENIDLRFSPQPNLWNVRIDPMQVDQILFNLAVNARDAMPDGGSVTIETSNVDLDEAHCALHPECRPGHHVLLSVADDGVGMNRETLSHAFEPFYTTKEVGKGTGLGLATVYGIVRQNGGFVAAHSEPESGTTFSVYIPRLMSEVEEEEVADTASLESHSATVLLVEDDDMVRRMTASILKRIGHSVVLAESPAEALAVFEQEVAPIDLLITDVVMPQMSGMQLASRIIEIRPEVKVLFMSGHTENVIVRQGVLEQGIHFIQKPFSMSEIAGKIREAIEDKHT